MANKRTNALTAATPSTLQILKASINFMLDDPSFSEARKIQLLNFLTTGNVGAAGNANDYQAMSPKSFKESVMSTTDAGVGQLSNDTNVTNKSGTGLLNASHQILMQTKWLNDWFTFNGVIPTLHQNAESASMFSMVYSFAWEGSLTAGGTKVITPSLPAGKEISRAYITSAFRLGTSLDDGTSIDFENRGPAAETPIGGTDAFIGAPSTWDLLYLKNGYTSTYNVAFAATIHLVMRG